MNSQVYSQVSESSTKASQNESHDKNLLVKPSPATDEDRQTEHPQSAEVGGNYSVIKGCQFSLTNQFFYLERHLQKQNKIGTK
jgi:hypothetical protein